MSSEADQSAEFQNVIEGTLTRKCMIKIEDSRSKTSFAVKDMATKTIIVIY
jgi:hypothetical protein